MSDEKIRNAVQFIKQGDKRNAGIILQEIVKENPSNENAWLYLAYCVAKIEHKRYCLEKIITINPNNLHAQKALKDLETQNLQTNPVISSSNTINKSEKKLLNKENPSKNKINITPILLAGSLFLFSLSIFIAAIFWVFSQKNLFAVSISPPLIISTPTDSPEKVYIEKMSQNMVLLNSFNNTLNKWDDLIASPIPGQYDETYGQSLSLFISSIPLGQSINDVESMLDFNDPHRRVTQANLTPVAQEISNKGFELLAAWHSVTPPPELYLPHEQIKACIQYKIDWANDIINLLQQYIIPMGDNGKNPCGNFANSVSAINAYLIGHSK